MKVYWVDCDVDNYQDLSQDLDSFEPLVAIVRTRRLTRCVAITESLTPPDVYSESPKLKRGDFWHIAAHHTFAVPPTSVEKVRSFLEEAGELVPLPFKEEVFSAFNILKCVDCIDPATPNKSDIRRLIFLADKVPFGIFRTGPGNPYIFVSEFTGDPATEFKAFVEHEGMTGLIFREIWSDER